MRNNKKKWQKKHINDLILLKALERISISKVEDRKTNKAKQSTIHMIEGGMVSDLALYQS